MCCSVLQGVAVCSLPRYRVLQCVATCCSVLHGVAGCCRVMQCVEAICRVLQCVCSLFIGLCRGVPGYGESS